ncbi:FHA domain-containing protein [Cytobacillus sp. FJAT-54145]|uniref:FHA domain-containing protein n=1 Tax=Cytobacillus spartinae TaxID=3299023 RepID=A0ABW6KAG5_9BACI
MKAPTYIIVETGSPFERGAFIPLQKEKVIIGRKVKNWTPDISFNNIYVSRKHLEIYSKNESFYIKDLNSKHGTFLNHQPLVPHEEKPLKDADQISISEDSIKFTFSTATMDLTADLGPAIQKHLIEHEFQLDPIKQEIFVFNHTYAFSEKEYKGIELLLTKCDQFVTVEELKKCVWVERMLEPEVIPDVSSEEMNALIYRIRKKTNDIFFIENVRGKGYILSFN